MDSTATAMASFNWIAMLSMIVWYVLGAVGLFVGYRVFDLLETKIDIAEEIKKGNMAAALLAGVVLLSIAAIIVSAMH